MPNPRYLNVPFSSAVVERERVTFCIAEGVHAHIEIGAGEDVQFDTPPRVSKKVSVRHKQELNYYATHIDFGQKVLCEAHEDFCLDDGRIVHLFKIRDDSKPSFKTLIGGQQVTVRTKDKEFDAIFMCRMYATSNNPKVHSGNTVWLMLGGKGKWATSVFAENAIELVAVGGAKVAAKVAAVRVPDEEEI